MNNNLEEKTTTEEEAEKEKEKEKKIKSNQLKNEEETENENEIRSRLRKNPKKTVLLYSAEDLNKYEKKKKKSDLKDTDFKIMKNVVDKLKISQKAVYFRTSAIRQFESKKDKEIYKSVIAHPMDLANITKKINNKKYNSFQEFYDDLTLIWDNAQLFNQSDSEVYEHAEYMRKYTEKIFREKELDDKVKPKEKKNKEFLKESKHINDDDEENENEENENEEKEIEKEDDENKKEVNLNENENVEIKVNNDEFNNVLIGKKRKYKKNKDKNKDNTENSDHKPDVNENDGELNPIINIKKNEESNESIELNKNDNSNTLNKNKKNKKKLNLNKSNSSDIDNNNNKDNTLKEENNISVNNSKEKITSTEEMAQNIIKDYFSNIIDNNQDNNENNISKINNDINSNSNIQKCADNIKQTDELNSNFVKDKTNNLNPQIDYINEKQNEEILKKREEDFKKNEWSEEKIKAYAHKIAKKFDKMHDEDMFDLIEFVESIRPQAVVDNGKYINIDMTKFVGDTYIKVWNFVENVLFKNSIIN